MQIVKATLFLVLCSCFALPVFATESPEYLPTKYGVALLTGSSYDPDHIGMVMVQGHIITDYKRFFIHRSPVGLRLKIEANLGITTDSRQRAMFSLNMLALKYFKNWQVATAIPYFEAGIGAIYTDFQVKDQGSRLNFNPQLGIGFKYPLPDDTAITLGFRLHHISNGGVLKDNRGVNSALLMLGYQF